MPKVVKQLKIRHRESIYYIVKLQNAARACNIKNMTSNLVVTNIQSML